MLRPDILMPVLSRQQRIAELKQELQKLEEEEKTDKPVYRLAKAIHSRFSKANHENGCGWWRENEFDLSRRWGLGTSHL